MPPESGIYDKLNTRKGPVISMVTGTVALLGSGELSATMVETHKKLLSRCGSQRKALFLDTPAGFQENVDLIARRAVEYFRQQVRREMEVASFKSAGCADSPQAGITYKLLGEAGYVLVGPGSPTYTVNHLKDTPIPTLLKAMVTRGGCLVAASAAALTVGSHTLPVYEIYKVGTPLHWVGGLNILGRLGLEMVVIPHWNNAEGGNHDTRFCYMGQKRFSKLEKDLPGGSTILGLDEHTAMVLDFSTGQAAVEGLGRVTVRRGGREETLGQGESVSFEQLRSMANGSAPGKEKNKHHPEQDSTTGSRANSSEPASSFWNRMHDIEHAFQGALEENDAATMTNLLLETDRFLWQAQLDLENPEFISQGREIYREMIVLAGTGIDRDLKVMKKSFNRLVNTLVEMREKHRQKKQWPEADHIRNILQDAGITLEDTREGPRWRVHWKNWTPRQL